MISHFRFPAVTIAPTMGAPAALAAPHPLLEVLRQLRGRQVMLLVRGGREIGGKLVSAEPLYLVTADGVARLVQIDQVQSVAY